MYKVSVAIMALFCASISAPLMAQSTDATSGTSQAAPVAQDLVQSDQAAPVAQNLVESERTPGLVSGFTLDFLNDQKAIWTSPFHMNAGDVKWLAPVVVAGGTLAIFDHKISDAAKANPSLQGPSNAISNVGLIAPWAAPGAMWFFGGIKHDDHATET